MYVFSRLRSARHSGQHSEEAEGLVGVTAREGLYVLALCVPEPKGVVEVRRENVLAVRRELHMRPTTPGA